MKLNKLFKILLIALAVLLLLSIIGKKAGVLGREKPVKISTEKIGKHTILGSVTANGKIQPEKEVKITPDVPGEVVDLLVKEGDSVTKGQLMLKIKPDVYISQRERTEAALNSTKAGLSNAIAKLSQAKAQFEQTRLSYERSKKLWKDRTISESEWETAQSAYDMGKAEIDASNQNVRAAEFQVRSSEAALKEAQENLTKTSIYAPISGTISMLNVEKGERVVGTNMYTGTEMLRIANLNRMEVKVDVNENDIVRVKIGDTAIIEVDAYPDRKFKGLVSEISNSANVSGVQADQLTNFTVKIFILSQSYCDLIVKGKKYPFRPGMSATVDILTEKKDNVIAVPIQAVATRADSLLTKSKKPLKKDPAGNKGTIKKEANELKEVIFVYKDHKALVREVKTGIQDNYFIEIQSGLSGDEEVIVAPYSAVSRKLKDGMIVEKVDKNKLFMEK
jgi:HlyD family secretion protein